MCENLEGQVTWSDLGISFGKMSKDACHQVPQKEQTSKQSSTKSSKSSAKRLPLFLSLKTDGPRPGASAEWVTAVAPFPCVGDYTMHSTGDAPSMLTEEYSHPALPNGVSVSRLSLILEDSPPQKYSLSAKACTGILNRAKKRGKELPDELRIALERQTCAMRTDL